MHPSSGTGFVFLWNETFSRGEYQDYGLISATYFATLSVSEITQRHIIGRLVNNELERICKETVAA
jgi:hypothetical protein